MLLRFRADGARCRTCDDESARAPRSLPSLSLGRWRDLCGSLAPLTALGLPTLALGENLGPELVLGGREALSGKGSGHLRRLISKPKSIHRVERVAWRGRDDLGWAWERVEGNLGVRAAMAVAKLVEKGRVVGLGATLGVL